MILVRRGIICLKEEEDEKVFRTLGSRDSVDELRRRCGLDETLGV